MRTCTFILNNVRLYEKKVSILIVIADPRIFIRIIRSYLCTVNSIADIHGVAIKKPDCFYYSFPATSMTKKRVGH